MGAVSYDDDHDREALIQTDEDEIFDSATAARRERTFRLAVVVSSVAFIACAAVAIFKDELGSRAARVKTSGVTDLASSGPSYCGGSANNDAGEYDMKPVSCSQRVAFAVSQGYTVDQASLLVWNEYGNNGCNTPEGSCGGCYPYPRQNLDAKCSGVIGDLLPTDATPTTYAAGTGSSTTPAATGVVTAAPVVYTTTVLGVTAAPVPTPPPTPAATVNLATIPR